MNQPATQHATNRPTTTPNHNPNDRTSPIPLHCLDLVTRPLVAVLAIKADFSTTVHYYLDLDDLRRQAIDKAQQLIDQQGADLDPEDTLEDENASASLLASPCLAFYLVKSPVERDWLCNRLETLADNLYDGVTQLYAEFGRD
jgi:hypothetical protein